MENDPEKTNEQDNSIPEPHRDKEITLEPTSNVYFERLIPRLGGLINGSRMCAEENTTMYPFIRNGGAQKFIEYLRTQGIEEESIVRVIKGGPLKGTWIHLSLANYLSCWLSPRMQLAMEAYRDMITLQSHDSAIALEKHKLCTEFQKFKEAAHKKDLELEKTKVENSQLKVEHADMKERCEKAVSYWHEQVQVQKCYLAYEEGWRTVYDYVFKSYGIKLSESETKALDKLAVESLKKKYGDGFYSREICQYDKWLELVKRKPSFKIDVIPPCVPSSPSHFRRSMNPKNMHVFNKEDWECIEDNMMPFLDKHRQQTIEEYGY